MSEIGQLYGFGCPTPFIFSRRLRPSSAALATKRGSKPADAAMRRFSLSSTFLALSISSSAVSIVVLSFDC